MLETLLCDLQVFVMNLRNSWTSLKRTKEAKNTFISNNHKREESKQKVSGLCLQGGRLPGGSCRRDGGAGFRLFECEASVQLLLRSEGPTLAAADLTPNQSRSHMDKPQSPSEDLHVLSDVM